jgi:hypothetical protein
MMICYSSQGCNLGMSSRHWVVKYDDSRCHCVGSLPMDNGKKLSREGHDRKNHDHDDHQSSHSFALCTQIPR